MLISLCDAKPEKSGIITGENNFQRILSYINLHLTSIQSVNDIANSLFFSKSYIMHLFKSELHVGVMQYIRNKKILLAHQKIRKGEKPPRYIQPADFQITRAFTERTPHISALHQSAQSTLNKKSKRRHRKKCLRFFAQN